jgi:hypothetical protein
MANVHYAAFCDPSGGSADSMTVAIVHREGEKVVLDAIREAKPPFSPEAVVAEFSELLKSYRLRTVTGDRYAGLWPTERFETHGIRYEAAAKPKSDLYRDWLPILNGKRCELLDHPKAISEICGLERRTARGGRDSIDHAPGAQDDLANCIAGAMTGQIIQDWSGGRMFFEMMRREKAAPASVTASGHPPGPPQPITREWARGSVEWQREQAGEIVPHAPREKPAGVPVGGGGTRRDNDEEIRELLQATLTPNRTRVTQNQNAAAGLRGPAKPNDQWSGVLRHSWRCRRRPRHGRAGARGKRMDRVRAERNDRAAADDQSKHQPALCRGA